MSSSKARSLRERMNIDPDAPEPVARPRRPRAAPTAPSEAAGTPAEAAETPAAAATVAPTPDPAPEPPAAGAADPAPPVVEPTAAPAADPPAPTDAAPSPSASARETSGATRISPRSASSSRSSRRSSRRKGRDDLGWTTALDDPSVSSGGNGYRSFYVSDEVFARFRAAVYWTARRPDATDVPDNMSVGIEDYMDQVASDLERRFNGKDVFPPTPDQLKAHRRRENGSRG